MHSMGKTQEEPTKKNVLYKGNILGSRDVRNQHPYSTRYAHRKSYHDESCPSKLATDNWKLELSASDNYVLEKCLYGCNPKASIRYSKHDQKFKSFTLSEILASKHLDVPPYHWPVASKLLEQLWDPPILCPPSCSPSWSYLATLLLFWLLNLSHSYWDENTQGKRDSPLPGI